MGLLNDGKDPAVHVLSFDFEEWFHVFGQNPRLQRQHWNDLPVMLPRITHSILEMLERRQAGATFFCLGWVASRYPELIRAISSAGHEVAAHSYWHEKVHQQKIGEFREDLARNIGELESITGKKVVSYRAPAFTLFPVSGPAVEILLQAGIRYDSSIMSGVIHKGVRLPNYPFTFGAGEESLIYFPVSTFPLFSHRVPYAGSGYFRLLPFGFVKNMLGKPGYHMLYFHPRDLDTEMHETKEFSHTERLRFLPGTQNSLADLDELLGIFRMKSMAETLKEEMTPLMIKVPGEKRM
jgi:polysaccharide deacetylase family protein (PEP-CTERM system associated)